MVKLSMVKLKFFTFLLVLLIGLASFSQESDPILIQTPDYTYAIDKIPQVKTPVETTFKAHVLYEQQVADQKAADIEFEKLTPDEKLMFEQSREFYLNKLAQILSHSQIGFGSLVSSVEFLKKIKKTLFTKKQKIPEGELGIIVRRLMQEEEKRLANNPVEKKSLKEKGQLAIARLLDGLNRNLYKQAKLVSSTDVVGFSVGVGLGANMGFGEMVVGGLGDFSFLFGFNRKTKSVVIEMHVILEKIKKALTPLLIVGVDIRGGLYFKNSEKTSPQKGITLLPPGLPTSFSNYPEHVDISFSTAIAFPPMVTDLMGYTSTSYRIPLIRVEIQLEPKLRFKFKTDLKMLNFKSATVLKCSSLF